MRKALVVTSDGRHEVVDLDGAEGTLKILQTAVGGWVQVVDLTPTLTMWLNEEGKVYGLPLNEQATARFQEVFGAVDVIVGDVIFTGGADEEGETLGLSDEDLAALTTTA